MAVLTLRSCVASVMFYVFSLQFQIQFATQYPPRVTHLDINLVAAQDDGNVFAHTLEVTVPVGNVLVGDTRRDVKHDDTALALDIVAVTETAKLFLTGRVPHVEANRTKVGVEGEGVDFDTERGCEDVSVKRRGYSKTRRQRTNVFLLKLAGQMTFDKSGL